MTKKKNKKTAKKDEAKANMDVTVGDKDETKADMDVSVEDGTDKGDDKAKKSPAKGWDAVEDALKSAMLSFDEEVSVEMSKGSITVKAKKLAQAKNASAVIWRKLGDLRREGVIEELPKVELSVG